MKWWGWGARSAVSSLPEQALEQLRGVLGAEARRTEPVALDEVQLGEPAAQAGPASVSPASSGRGWVRDDRLTRVLHAAGKSYPDLVRMRSGQAEQAPDAVVYPESADQVAALLRLCGEHGVAVVPFGGGTSVVGGVEPIRGSFESLIALDLERMTAVTAVDERSLTAELGPGLARAAGGGRTRPLGPHARPFPAVVRVRDPRRLGCDQLGRPGLDRLRQDRGDGRRGPLRDALRERSSHARFPRAPPVRSYASCWSAPRECSG